MDCLKSGTLFQFYKECQIDGNGRILNVLHLPLGVMHGMSLTLSMSFTSVSLFS
jgi:hypothetical protein